MTHPTPNEIAQLDKASGNSIGLTIISVTFYWPFWLATAVFFEGRFLKVQGTYKIHLGSSNILLEPNDQYLCIVAIARGGQIGPTGLSSL